MKGDPNFNELHDRVQALMKQHKGMSLGEAIAQAKRELGQKQGGR